jgi:hypothetical protein
MDRQRDWLGVSNVKVSTICSEARSAAQIRDPMFGPEQKFSQAQQRPCNDRQETRRGEAIVLPDHATRLPAPIEFLHAPIEFLHRHGMK